MVVGHPPRRARAFALVSLLLVALPAVLPAQAAFDKAEFAARRAKLIERIGDGVAVVFAAPETTEPIAFRQWNDFYYLTGIEEPGAVLLLNGASKQATVFAPKLPQWKSASEGGGLRDDANAADRYGIPVQPMENFFTILNFASFTAKKLYVPLSPHDNLLAARFERKMQIAAELDNPLLGHEPATTLAVDKIHAAQPQLELADLAPHVDELRWVKTPYEIARLREAGRIGAEAVAEAMRGTKPGMFEYELAAKARYVNSALGARGDAFPPIVASGPNTMIVHYTANNRKIAAGDVVYIDYGSDYEYYTSDITRTWPGGGKFTAEQEKMYRCVLEARNAIIAAMKPGITIRQMQDIAEPVYEKHGFKQQFLQSNRYVGHFIGLSVHDVGDTFGPGIDKPFVAGVVFNVEPILQIPETKTHVRLEDTILITPNGAENLTAGVPAGIDEVYSLVKQEGIAPKLLNKAAPRATTR